MTELFEFFYKLFEDPLVFFRVYLFFCLIILFRYFSISALFYWKVWPLNSIRKKTRRLQAALPNKHVIKSEITWSVLNSFIYAMLASLVFFAWQQGYSKIYADLSAIHYAYLPLSILIYLLLQETYFYWMHRLLHHQSVFRFVHKNHHDSLNPTPWAAYCFHSFEVFVGALFVAVLTFFLPIHIFCLIIFILIMALNAAISHSGYEIFPESWMKGLFGRVIITATHHNQHHRQLNTNYGQFFRLWDLLMKTDLMNLMDSDQRHGVAPEYPVIAQSIGGQQSLRD